MTGKKKFKCKKDSRTCCSIYIQSCFYASTDSSGIRSFSQLCIDPSALASSTPAPSIQLAAASDVSSLKASVDISFILVCAILVFWMQAGFSMLESGSVRPKNTNNILFKNLMDAAIGAIAFWLLGYSFAFGNGRTYANNPGQDNRFIGAGNWALQDFTDDTSYHLFFFQWAFSAAATTIVSGSLAERCKLEAYFLYSVYLTAFVYPIVVHWVWSGTGFLSATYMDENGNRYLSKNGMIDFAGSGVVHAVGGVAGLIGTMIMGPRQGFYGDAERTKATLKGSNELLCSLGVSILWMGWYAFNGGSAFGYLGTNTQLNVAAKSTVCTTISAAASAISTTIFSRFFLGHYDLILCLNGVLAGLVSVTAGAGIVEPWAAMLIGIIGSGVYIIASYGLKALKIDDPLDAFPVHGACGIWGCLAVGIFATRSNIVRAYGFDNDAISSGNQFKNQLIGIVCIVAWVATMMTALFVPLKYAGLLRISAKVEHIGLDVMEHGVPWKHNAAAVDKRARAERSSNKTPSRQQSSNPGSYGPKYATQSPATAKTYRRSSDIKNGTHV